MEKQDDGTATSPQEILLEIRQFYQDLYAKQLDINNVEDEMEKFMENEPVPQLGENLKEDCDKEINIKELDKALNVLNKDSSPGCDGLTVNFYEYFWDRLRPLLYRCLLEALEKGHLSITQKRGVITLLHKDPALPQNKLNDWRPIT